MEPILQYDHVSIAYGSTEVVHDVSFAVAKGHVLCLVGESGSGKTTLLKGAMGLLGAKGLVSHGHIWYQTYDLSDVDRAARQRLNGAKLAMVWQDAGAALCPIRTIGDQCMETVLAHQKMTKEAITERTLHLFHDLGFADGEAIWQSYTFQLSGGMNQRVGIAMALLLQPDIIFADEPTSALDVATQKQVLTMLRTLQQRYGTTIVFVTHDMNVVKFIADDVVVLRDGCVVEAGTAVQVLGAPQQAYTQALVAATPTV